MNSSNAIPRRDFLKSVAASGAVAGIAARDIAAAPEKDSVYKIHAFDFDGVALRDSRWKQQYDNARDFYYSVPDDDILHGFRAAAGLPAPGKPLGGWAEPDSSVVMGQWLSGMSRLYRSNADTAMRDKAAYLMREFAKTVPPDGNARMDHYPYEKMVCGLVDMHNYAHTDGAIDLLERMTDYASKNFDRTRRPASPVPWENHSGKPLEWYTLSENLFRAYLATGNPKFKEFAEVWQYHPYWNKFAETASPAGATSVHAYSHVNSFSGAAMSYVVEGDPKYLNII
ncbi:MAG TPA: beta-L-arabinofuranosidase domain-containing protein, partial [Terriglobia bacterium]|nr:beta-L-arabinofuranosidase domain-containing protein [Terriglobia bacterium]